jgi:hypothetical protein
MQLKYRLLLLFIVLVGYPLPTKADSYSITVPGGGLLFFASYHFTNQTISQIFPNGSMPWSTQLYRWNNSNQSYDTTQTLSSIMNGWYPNPNFVLQAGDVFFLRNNSSTGFSVTISGNQISGSKPLALYTNQNNGYGPVRLPADMLECVCPYNSSMSYPGTDGDQLIWWDPDLQDWVTQTRQTTEAGVTWEAYCDGGMVGWAHDNNDMYHAGWGAFFVPAVNKTWTYDSPEDCTE